MEKYIVFKKGQYKKHNKEYKYEPNTKYRITSEDDNYYYILNDKFNKSTCDYDIGDIIGVGRIASDYMSEYTDEESVTA